MRALTPIRTLQYDWRPAILAALAALGVFAVTLKGTYIYDDLTAIQGDARVSDPSRWYQFWTQGYMPGALDNLYRPLTSTTYGVQWWINGDRPWAFHLVNWLLFAACAAAVAELARRMGGSLVAYAAGLLFAVHPIHTEVVAELVGRADLLCTLFFLLALILLARRPLTLGRAWGVFACCVLSLLSKEQGLLLPLVLLIYAACRWIDLRRTAPSPTLPQSTGGGSQSNDPPLAYRGRESKKGNSPTLILTLLLCWFWAGYLLFREWLLPMEWDRARLDWTLNPMARAEGWSRLLVPISMLGRYVQLLVAPWKLAIDYGWSVIGWEAHPGDPYLYIGLAAMVLWIALLIWALRGRRGMVIFCLLAMALTWGMISNIGVLIGANFGERLVFLPSAFFLILAAMGIVHLPRWVFIPLLSLCLILGALRTVTYARYWNNRLAFYEYSLRQQPRSITIRIALATDLMLRGQLERADQVMVQARQQYADYWQVWTTSFDIAWRQHRVEAARRYLARAAKIIPNPTYLWWRRDDLKKLEKAQASPAAAPASRRSSTAPSAGATAR